MEIKIMKESGIEQALLGMKFSFQTECDLNDIQILAKEDFPKWMGMEDAYKRYLKYMETAKKLCKKDGGHNKMIEQMQVWMTIRASLEWWKQFDTYRVGTSKLSKSTMHTIMKKPISAYDFSDLVDQRILDIVEEHRLAGDFLKVSENLPQGFLQTRMVNTNYKVLRNVIMQRKNHKLLKWEFFINHMMENLKYPELLGIS